MEVGSPETGVKESLDVQLPNDEAEPVPAVTLTEPESPTGPTDCPGGCPAEDTAAAEWVGHGEPVQSLLVYFAQLAANVTPTGPAAWMRIGPAFETMTPVGVLKNGISGVDALPDRAVLSVTVV